MNQNNQNLSPVRQKLLAFWNRLSDIYSAKSNQEFANPAALIRRKYILRVSIYFGFSVVLAGLISHISSDIANQVLPSAGDVAEEDILAPFTADIEPRELRAHKQDETARRIAPVFDYDDAAIESWLTKWKGAFAQIRDQFYSSRFRGKNAPLGRISDRLYELTGQTVGAPEIQFLHQHRFSPQVEAVFVKMGEYLLGRLIAPIDLFSSYYSTGIIVRQQRETTTEVLVHDLSRIWSLEQAREFIARVPRLANLQTRKETEGLVRLLQTSLVANLSFNQDLTQKRINTILGLTKAPTHTIKRGSVLARKGERISESLAELFRGIDELMTPQARLFRFGLTTAVLFILIMAIFRFTPNRKSFWHLNLKDATFFMGGIVLHLVFLMTLQPWFNALLKILDFPMGSEYFLPTSMGAVVIHLTLGKETAFLFALLASLVSGYYLERDFLYAAWIFVVMIIAVQTIRSCKQRTDLYKCGLITGAVSAVLILVIQLTQTTNPGLLFSLHALLTIVFATVSGLLSAILAGAVIPLFENLFGYTTSLKLLEVANFNHPLLHTLMLKAPGTYHHSILVGSLAEMAADQIHANALLARVSAYYHDIGKMNKPLYFIENQNAGQNPHDHLQPAMSAKILFSHVKHGAKMARDYGLGMKITDIIQQHHGTTLVSYFYGKAKKSEDPAVSTTQEADFRYPGPKPQTREAAIVMVADACEAATRSISDPTPQKIQTMVHSIVNKRFLDGQFTECDLTIKDLHAIEDSFVRTLVFLHHHRIEYPGQNQMFTSSPNRKPQEGTGT